jgi:hypothetical protein
MLLLSSILGPAKPPVASRDDVASAPGVYRITSNADRTFVARASAGGEELVFDSADRCLICLCDYQLLEEVRQLGQCRHIFHRECIDEVRHISIAPGGKEWEFSPVLAYALCET